MQDKLRVHAELTIKLLRALEERNKKNGYKLKPWQRKLLKSASKALKNDEFEVSQTSLADEQV